MFAQLCPIIANCQIILLSVLATFVDEITRILKVAMITLGNDDASIMFFIVMDEMGILNRGTVVKEDLKW